MGKRSKNKLIIRSVILIITTLLIIANPKLLSEFMQFSIKGNFKIYNLLWIYLMYEMIIVLIPQYNDYTYSGKQFARHYKCDENYNKEKLDTYIKKNNIRALRALVFWVALNGIIAFLYLKFDLNDIYMYWLFVFYYWSDMFCVNVWCPFHKIIVKNKCCNECRIYNWGHIMYLTPLILIPSLWTYSLVTVGIVIFIQWEYLNLKHPERFSPISNKSLRCSICKNNCRYNKHKQKYKQIS